MLLILILSFLTINPLFALNFTECEQCILPEIFSERMKRHGGGARGGARARGVLRADGNATAGGAAGPAGGNATAGGAAGPAGGNATAGGAAGPAGGNDTAGGAAGPAGGNDTAGGAAGPAGGNDTAGGAAGPAGLNATNVPNGNGTGNATPAIFKGPLLGDEEATTLSPEQVDALFPHPDTSQTCQYIYKTDKTAGAAVILFRKSGNLLCMGTIVDHKHILTAKKCVNIASAPHLLVIVGCSKPWWGHRSQVKGVRKILNHEYEAALLRLKGRIVYTKFVQPAKLPSSATKGTKLTYLYEGPYYVMGFAVDKHAIPGEKVSKNIFYGFQTDWYYELQFCEKIHNKVILDPDKVFCVAGAVTYCWGAWGAPVFAKVNDIMIQIGVVSADACTSIKSGPYVAFRTDSYSDWIKGHLKELHQPT